MTFNPNIHHRVSSRLQNYDYATAGVYFITICTHQRACLLGDIINGVVIVSECGKVVKAGWDELPMHDVNVVLDEFVVMPNHVHAIILLQSSGAINQGAMNRAPTDEQQHAPAVGARFIAPKKSTTIGAQFIAPKERWDADA